MVKENNPPPKSLRRRNGLWLVAIAALFYVGIFYALPRNVSISHGQNETSQSASTPRNTIGRLPITQKAAINLNTKRSSDNRTVSYRGVRFDYNPTLASEIKAEIEPAYPLQEETDIPEGAYPEHYSFKFLGAYADQHRQSFFQPQIAIYPIADYKQSLAKSESYVKDFEADIQMLKEILSARPKSIKKNIPFMPYGINASQCFHARVKYIEFQHGKGVMFLTQYNQEPSLINNQGLIYSFQGLTDDSIYYVSAIFPVTTPVLPESYEAESADDYTLTLPRSFHGREYALFEKRYNEYLGRTIIKLEQLPPDNYQPNLIVLEDLIQTLNVKNN